MVDFLLVCFISSLSVLATWYVFNDDDNPISRVKYYFRKLPMLIRMPLFDCLPCMSSLWGTSYIVVVNLIFGIDLDLKIILSVVVVTGIEVIYFTLIKIIVFLDGLPQK